MQKIIESTSCVDTLATALHQLCCKRFMLVCGQSVQHSPLFPRLQHMGITFVLFDQFRSNPLYEEVCKGVEIFRREKCEAVVAIGGGSAMDVAKCIKLYSPQQPSDNYLALPLEDSRIPLLAIPTTAGTGSESTQYAVIYKDGAKQSVHHATILPDYAILDASLLQSLPSYQKRCTLLDALCQAIESWWSVNSTPQSQELSLRAVQGILSSYEGYLDGNPADAVLILRAANLAGQAIAYTQTTAPHAMSYKLTSLFGIPHGHAVALSLPEVWDYMYRQVPAPEHPLHATFLSIAHALGGDTIEEGIARFRRLLLQLDIQAPRLEFPSQLDLLAASVNTTRLKNNPIPLSYSTLHQLYKQLFRA